MKYKFNYWLLQDQLWYVHKPHKDIEMWQELREIAEEENWPKKRNWPRERPTKEPAVYTLGRLEKPQ